MLVTVLLVLFGLPLIGVLAWRAWAQARTLSLRIAEVQAEQERAPRSPLMALSELMRDDRK